MAMHAMRTALKAAVERRGSLTEVARLLGITRQAIGQWESVPPKHVLGLERLSGVSRYAIRPDIYGPEPASKEETTT